MKEIKKPYNVYLIKNSDGTEELKFIQGVFNDDYKIYLGLYALTDDEVKFPVLDYNTGEIYLNKNLKKIDDHQKAIENLENYYKNNPEKPESLINTNKTTNVFLKINEDSYFFNFELHDQVNILSQIVLELDVIKIKGIKNKEDKPNLEFSLEEAKNIYKLLYNNLNQ